MSIQSTSSIPLQTALVSTEQRAPVQTANAPQLGASPADAASSIPNKPSPASPTPSQTERAANPGQTPTNPDDVRQALNEVREAIKPVAQNLLFSIDDDTGKTVIKIIDSSTDEVIKQIPSEEIIAISKALDKLQGLLIKQEI